MTYPVPFELTASTFENVREFRFRLNRITNCTCVNSLISELREWSRALKDAEGEQARTLNVLIWRLRSAVLFGLLSFDNPTLRIEKLAADITIRGDSFPDLRERCERLSELVELLLSNPGNPKRDAVRAKLEYYITSGKLVGLVVALARNHLPGLTELIEGFQTFGQGIQFVASRRHFLASTFEHIIIPFGTRYCALTDEILNGYRAREVTVIAYKSEAMASRRKIYLPCAIGVNSRPRIEKVYDPKPQQEASKENGDFPEEEVFWSSIKQEVSQTEEMADLAVADRDYFVPGRGVLLANGAHVFLRDDSKAVEISDFVEGRQSLDIIGRRFPRTPVKHLQTGDLIVLRVKGSGEYLIEVADSLIRKDGREGLRSSAMDWKHLLYEVLRERGSRWFLQQLEKRGFHLADHNYLWRWTTDEVISPQIESYFYETIAILEDCGRTFGERDVLEAAKRRWEEMKDLKRYHIKAGQEIRNILLGKVRSIIDSQLRIGSQYELQIPGVSAGVMAIVRIAAVDAEVVSIPYNRSGVLIYPLKYQRD